MPTLYTINCEYCNKSFKALPRSKDKKFCNRVCANSSRHGVNYQKFDNCKNCNITLLPKQKMFCSNSCAGTYNNAKKDYSTFKSGPPKKEKIKELPFSKLFKCVCKHCGVVWFARKHTRICTEHTELYSHNGRAKFWFTFSINKYPDIFDSEILRIYGMRSKTNPNGITRDHKVSVNEAIKNNYDPYYITHPLNCELMKFRENAAKYTKSSISYEELRKIVDEYETMCQS